MRILKESNMAEVKWIASTSNIPADKQFVLINYGRENGLRRHPNGLTYSVDRNLSPNLLEAHVQTVISDALAMADFEEIETVYVAIPKKAAQR
jgi:hypothetical protein